MEGQFVKVVSGRNRSGPNANTSGNYCDAKQAFTRVTSSEAQITWNGICHNDNK